MLVCCHERCFPPFSRFERTFACCAFVNQNKSKYLSRSLFYMEEMLVRSRELQSNLIRVVRVKRVPPNFRLRLCQLQWKTKGLEIIAKTGAQYINPCKSPQENFHPLSPTLGHLTSQFHSPSRYVFNMRFTTVLTLAAVFYTKLALTGAAAAPFDCDLCRVGPTITTCGCRGSVSYF